MRTYQLGNGLVFTIMLFIFSVTAFPAQSKNQQYEAELDQMLAPIALYPDSILTHILIAATYPLEVVQASRWLEQHPTLRGEAAIDAAEHQDWDPSVKALLAFPQILQRLNDDLSWTQRLGDIFLEDEPAMLASIQRLRQNAYAHGSLAKMEHVVIEREREVIIIEPAQREVVYVPVYDTRIVYGNWWWPSHPPLYWHSPVIAQHNSYFYWSAGYRIRPSFYFSAFNWHHHHVIVHHHYHHRPPSYYPRRQHFQHAPRWQHDHYHRRGVHYRQQHSTQRYTQRHERSHDTPNRNRQQWRTERQQAAVPVQQDRFIPRESRLRETVRYNNVQQPQQRDNRAPLHASRDSRELMRNPEPTVSERVDLPQNRRESRIQQNRQPSLNVVETGRDEQQIQPVAQYRTERRQQTASQRQTEARQHHSPASRSDSRPPSLTQREQRARISEPTRPEQHTQPITLPRTEQRLQVSPRPVQEQRPAAVVNSSVERNRVTSSPRSNEPRATQVGISERSARFDSRRVQQDH